MTNIAHVSDIHFGAIDADAAERLADQINAAGVDAIILTGDLTQAGRKREFQAAAAFIRRFRAPVMAVPGNHDAPVYNVGQRMTDPWRRFRAYVQDELRPTARINDVLIIGLNSARRAGPSLDWSRGRLSAKQLKDASDELRGAEDAVLKLVAFHHPVLPGPGPAGDALINNPARAMHTLSEAGADALLTGHVHIANAQVHETPAKPIIVAAAGTAASTRLRGEKPSYNLLQWTGVELHVTVQRYERNEFTTEKRFQFSRENGAWRQH
ncbi:MAG: metallophosphoesterase [Pseudomonadota bacterium]